MRILLLSYYFPPTGGPGAIRWANLLKYFAAEYKLLQKSWDFEIITVKSDIHPVIDPELGNLIPKNSKVHYIDSPEKYYRRSSGSFLRIGNSHNIFLPDSKFWFIRASRKIADRIIEERGKFDIIIASSPPFSAYVAGVKISEKHGIPVIADMRDSYLLDPNPPPPLRFIARMKKNLFYRNIRNANGIVAVNRVVQKEMYFRSLGKVPVEYIPNGVPRIKKIRSDDRADTLKIAMAGRFYGNLNFPGEFLQALMILKNKGINFEMRFLGPADILINEKIKKLGLEEHIEITGSITYSKILEELPKADVLFTSLDSRPGNSRQIQSKIWDYLGAGKPIVAAVPLLSPGAQVINLYEAGIVVPETAMAIAEALLEAKKMHIAVDENIFWKDRASQYAGYLLQIAGS